MHQTMKVMPWPRRTLATSAVLALLGMGCVGVGEPPSAPNYGSVRVTVRSIGGDLDQDGYTIVLDGERRQAPQGGSAVIGIAVQSFYVPAGTHAVALEGVDANCTLNGEKQRSVSAVFNQIVDVQFDVACAATGFTLTTRTTGPDQPEWLELQLDDQPADPDWGPDYMTANGSRTFTRLAPGPHTLSLRTVEHCTVAGGSRITIDVRAKTIVQVPLDVTCTTATRLEKIAFVHDSTLGDFPIRVIRTVKVDGTGVASLGWGYDPSWSPARTRLAFSNTQCFALDSARHCQYGLVVMDPEREDGATITNGYAVFHPSWVPTGDAVVFESYVLQSDDRELQVYHLETGIVDTLAIAGPRSKEQPSWSPSGARIAFVCRWEVHVDLCVVGADGSALVRLTDDAEEDRHPAWSPDGSRIAFARTASTGATPQIVLLDVATRQLTVLTPGTEPAWSPDGSKLVFAGSDGLFVINADGSNRRRLTTGPDHSPAWRP